MKKYTVLTGPKRIPSKIVINNFKKLTLLQAARTLKTNQVAVSFNNIFVDLNYGWYIIKEDGMKIN